jgi:hypothetical protein
MDTFRKQEQLKPYFDSSYGFAAFEKIGKVRLYRVHCAKGINK